MGKRYKDAKTSNMDTPGPGSYVANDKGSRFGRSPSYGMGVSKRD